MSEIHQREIASLNEKLTVTQMEHEAVITKLKLENNNALNKMADSHDQQMKEVLSLQLQRISTEKENLKQIPATGVPREESLCILL